MMTGRFANLFLVFSLCVLVPSWVVGAPAADDVKATVNSLKDVTFVGKKSSVNVDEVNYAYHKFQGIKYGTSARFEKSEMFDGYSNQQQVMADKKGAICYQDSSVQNVWLKSDVMSEDCLFLNIYTPANANKNSKKPVYIFIHGGVFLKGSGSFYDGSAFAAKGDIIVVTINYRLGALGFLTTGDNRIKANLGLWDQNLAIKWVNQHIRYFGGDETQVTVGGQSAGSYSSLLQSMYSGNDGLFQNVIAQSGTPLALKGVASMKKAKKVYTKFAETMKCKTLACLKMKEAKTIVNTGFGNIDPQSMNFWPTNDGDFINQDVFSLSPQQVKKFEAPKKVPIYFTKKNLLIGFNEHDGAVAYKLAVKAFAQLIKLPVLDTLKKPLINSFAAKITALFTSNKPLSETDKDIMKRVNTIFSIYFKLYPSVMKSPNIHSDVMIKFFTDFAFAVPAINTARVHSGCASPPCSQAGNTFVYKFRLPSNSTQNQDNYLPWFSGTKHEVELKYLMDFPLGAGVNTIMPAFINFIKTGNPNKAGQSDWMQYNQNAGGVFLLADSPKLIGKKSVIETATKFWNIDLFQALKQTKK